jgi:hypothetical protein
MIKKMIIEHFHGASIIGLLPEGKLINDDFIDYIKPVARIYRVHAKKYKRPSEPYKGPLKTPVKIFELLSPQ